MRSKQIKGPVAEAASVASLLRSLIEVKSSNSCLLFGKFTEKAVNPRRGERKVFINCLRSFAAHAFQARNAVPCNMFVAQVTERLH